MRAYHKSWQDKRPGWTRRIRWLQGPGNDIRLELTDADGRVSLYPDNAEIAQEIFDDFIAGAIEVRELITDQP